MIKRVHVEKSYREASIKNMLRGSRWKYVEDGF